MRLAPALALLVACSPPAPLIERTEMARTPFDEVATIIINGRVNNTAPAVDPVPVPLVPIIDMLSEDEGEVADSITFTGSRFIGVTAVHFNGVAATFAIVDDTTLVAIVPNDATSGSVSATNAQGVGYGPTFSVLANTFAADLTGPILPSHLAATRAGDTIYAQLSAETVQAITEAAVYENRGDAQGGAQWTFPNFRNGLAALLKDFSSSVYTYTGAPTYTADDALAPDGTQTADKLEDAQTGVSKSIAFADLSATSAEPLLGSVWVKDDAANPPTAPGAVSPIAKLFCASLGSGLSWRRRTGIWYNFAIPQGRHLVIMPAGAAVQADGTVVEDPAATGAVHLSLAQATKGLALLPTVAGSSGDLTISARTPADQLAGNGDLHIEGAFLMDLLFNNGSPPGYPDPYIIYSAQTPLGEFRLEYADQVISAYFNGSNIINGIAFNRNIGYLGQGGELRWEFWNRPSVNDSGMQFFLSGERTDTLRSISVTQATPTTGDLGHQGGAKIMPRRWTLWRKTTRNVDAADFVILGDSIVSAYSPYSSVGSRILTLEESRSKQIVSYATPGETVTQQYNRWLASAQRSAGTWQALIAHVGVNDFIAGDSAAAVTARLQTLVTDVNTQSPGKPLILSPIAPCKVAMDARDVVLGLPVGTIWSRILVYNSNIAGSGPNPITGSSLTRLPSWSGMDDGGGNLIPAYSTTDAGAAGDGLHENTNGRIHMAVTGFRAALVTLGEL